MKRTLLQITQDVLRSIKGEEVDSISDTAESLAVAGIIREAYYGIVGEKDFDEMKSFFELTASGDATKPVLMYVPSQVYGMEWLKYNVIASGDTDPVWKTIHYMNRKTFMDYTQSFNLDATEVDNMSLTLNTAADSIDFKHFNDRAPSFYTDVDDYRVVFDAYDNTVDTTLQKTKTMAYGTVLTDWSETDGFVPALDAQQAVLLLKEAKALAWYELRDTPNPLALKQARFLRINAEKKKHNANYNRMGYYYDQYPNYGRK